MDEGTSSIGRIQISFHRIAQSMRPKLLESMQKYDVTPTQFFVLSFLRAEESANISQLAEAMDVKPSAVTFMVDRLLQHGLVEREHDDKDRRIVNVKLTVQGTQKYHAIIEERREITARYLSLLTADELALLANLGEKIVTGM